MIVSKTDTGTFNFNQQVKLNNTFINFYGCNFYDGLDLTQKSFGYISGGLLRQNTYSFRVRYLSLLLIDANITNLSFEGAGNNLVFFDLYNTGNLILNGSFTLKGSFYRFISATSNSFIRIANQVNINTDGEISGQAYFLSRASVLDLYGKGNAVFPETLTQGSMDESCLIC